MPIFGFTLMGGYPVAPHKAEASKNRENTVGANQAGTLYQSSPQKTTGQNMTGCAGEKETTCPAQK
jgi:hypothetical protein